VDRHRWLAHRRVVLDPTPRISAADRTSFPDAVFELIRSVLAR